MLLFASRSKACSKRSPDLKIVAEARTGVEAVSLAAQLSPSVVVLDLNMPTMDGIHATRLIKHHSPAVPVIGLTAGDTEERQRAMRSAGADALVYKEDALDV